MDDDGRLTAILKCLQGKPFDPGSDLVASRLMEVRMHRQTWLALVRSLPPQTVEDWTHGMLRVDDATGSIAPHKLRVRQSAAAATEADPDAGVKMLHENAREWWEECAKLETERREPGVGWMPNASGGYPFSSAQEGRGEVEHGEAESDEPAEGSKGAIVGEEGGSGKEARRIEAEEK